MSAVAPWRPLAPLFDSDVAYNLIPFLGLLDALLVYVHVSKGCYKRLITKLLINKKDVERAKPVEKSESLILDILVELMYTAVDVGVVELTPEAYDMLKRTGRLGMDQQSSMPDLCRIASLVYTNWNTMPSDLNNGIFQAFAARMSLKEDYRQALIEDVQYWRSSRVAGNFIVLFDRPDGTILVTANYKKVYLVLGNRRSVGEMFNIEFKDEAFRLKPPYTPPSLHGPVLGVHVYTTLLNWRDTIIFNGTYVMKGIATKEQLRLALQAYAKAVDQESIIARLPKREGSHMEMKVAVPVDPDQVRTLKVLMSTELMALRTASRSRFVLAGTPFRWIFRLYGYTEEENPRHLTNVYFDTKSSAKEFFRSQDLVPTLQEHIHFMYLMSQKYGKPDCMQIENAEHVELLRGVLNETGISVDYSPPFSKEEADLNDEDFVRSCGLCHRPVGPNGEKLLRCARCRVIRYCCKKHQKQHWKVHKRACDSCAAMAAEGFIL